MVVCVRPFTPYHHHIVSFSNHNVKSIVPGNDLVVDATLNNRKIVIIIVRLRCEENR